MERGEAKRVVWNVPFALSHTKDTYVRPASRGDKADDQQYREWRRGREGEEGTGT